MEALKALVKNKKAEIGATVYVRGDFEAKRREEYLEREKKGREEQEERLGKRLKKLEEFYEEAGLKTNQDEEMFEPMKKVLTHKKKTKKTEKEEEEKEKVMNIDTTHRDCNLFLT